VRGRSLTAEFLLDPIALSGHSGSSLEPNIFTYQSALDPAPLSSHPQHYAGLDTWDVGQQGLCSLQPSFSAGPLALPGHIDFGNFIDQPTAFPWSTNLFDFNPLTRTPQPWVQHTQTMVSPALDEPPFVFDHWVEPQQFVAAPLPAPVTAPPLAAPIAAPLPAPSNRIACSSPGCGKTFRRAGDCRRHMLKHGPPRFICPLNGCTMPFTRADKLRDHLRQGHKIDQTRQRNSA
jgi:hypothetical protein